MIDRRESVDSRRISAAGDHERLGQSFYTKKDFRSALLILPRRQGPLPPVASAAAFAARKAPP